MKDDATKQPHAGSRGDCLTYDVIVVGSGCAGLTAALKAAAEGASVVVLEKSRSIGGTSAMSGAGTWVPANHHAIAAGVSDSVDAALEYIHAASPEGWAAVEGELWRRYAEASPRMLRFVEDRTPVRFEVVSEPDPTAEAPGGLRYGRMLSPKAYSLRRLGRLGYALRRSTLQHIFTYREMISEPLYTKPLRTGLRLLPRIVGRWLRGERGQGSALVGGLLEGCLESGCEILPDAAVAELICDDHGAVVGVRAAVAGNDRTFRARRGVVLATGGFEWNAEMFERHFPGGAQRIGSPRTNTGDGQRMAQAVGAQLDRMDQANVYPCLPTIYEGELHGLPVTFQCAPHSIVVNARGERFADEYDYNLGEALDRRDPETGQAINMPAWLVGDRRFLAVSPAFRWYAAKDRDWIRKADSLAEIAGQINVPAEALERTVARFNRFCAAGKDADFGRGDSVWGRYKSKRKDGQPDNPALGEISRGPFVAMAMNRMILGTKGGARTDAGGRVLRDNGSPIIGLYCAGNAMANPFGTRAIGAGTTIGPCMTWGYICAESILSSNR